MTKSTTGQKTIWQIMNVRFIITLLLGTLLIVLSHYVIDQHTSQSPSLIGTILHEAGFALIVALVIWGMFEFFSQVESEDIWNERIERIAKSVFFGVFRRNFPQQLIQEANVLLLEQTFIRSGMHVSYTLRDDKIKREDDTEISFVRLEAVARYKVRNVGNSSSSHPLRIALPNPFHPELKKLCGVNRVTLRRKGKPEILRLDEAEKEFRDGLAKNTTDSQGLFALPAVSLAADEEIEVVWDYVMVKEEEDTEIMQTLYPTDSVVITVMDTNPSRRAVFARSVHPASLEDDTSAKAKGTYNFRLDRYLLPHQGFVIWWKKDRREGGTKAPAEH